MPKPDLNYMVDVFINQSLNESDKNQLMLALSDAMKKTLGEIHSGFVLIHSQACINDQCTANLS